MSSSSNRQEIINDMVSMGSPPTKEETQAGVNTLYLRYAPVYNLILADSSTKSCSKHDRIFR